MGSKIVEFKNSLNNSRRGSQQSNSTKQVLTELFTLLEEYAPVWYSEDLHNRVVASLGNANPVGSVVAPRF